MPFKFPLPGPLKGSFFPGEGLDGDRLRAGWVSAWVLRGLQKRFRFGAGLGFGLAGLRAGFRGWSGFRVLVLGWSGFRAGLDFGLAWVPGWARFSGVLRRDCGLGLVWFLREKVHLGRTEIFIARYGEPGPSIAPQPDAGERAWNDCA